MAKMAKADFVTSVVLIALGVAGAVESARMPRFENLNIEPYTVPGIVPGILSVILTLLGVILFIRACASGGWRLEPGRMATALFSSINRRLAIGLALTLGYSVVLVGRMPFWLATAIFMFLFVGIYERGTRDGVKARAVGLATGLLLAVIVAVAVTWEFQSIFLVRLPYCSTGWNFLPPGWRPLPILIRCSMFCGPLCWASSLA